MFKLYSTFWTVLVAGSLVPGAQAQSIRLDNSGTVCPGRDWQMNCTWSGTTFPSSLSPFRWKVELQGDSDSDRKNISGLVVPQQGSITHGITEEINHNGVGLRVNASLGWLDSGGPNEIHFVLHGVQRIMDGLKVTCRPCDWITDQDNCQPLFQGDHELYSWTNVSVWQEPSVFFREASRITGEERNRLVRENSTAFLDTVGNNPTSYLFFGYGGFPEGREFAFQITLLVDGTMAGSTITTHSQAVIPLLSDSSFQLQLGGSNCGSGSPVFSDVPVFSEFPLFAVNRLGQPTFAFNASGVIHDTELTVESDGAIVNVSSETPFSDLFTADLSFNVTLGGPAKVLNVTLGGSTAFWNVSENFVLLNLDIEVSPPLIAASEFGLSREAYSQCTVYTGVAALGGMLVGVVAITVTATLCFLLSKKRGATTGGVAISLAHSQVGSERDSEVGLLPQQKEIQSDAAKADEPVDNQNMDTPGQDNEYEDLEEVVRQVKRYRYSMADSVQQKMQVVRPHSVTSTGQGANRDVPDWGKKGSNEPIYDDLSSGLTSYYGKECVRKGTREDGYTEGETSVVGQRVVVEHILASDGAIYAVPRKHKIVAGSLDVSDEYTGGEMSTVSQGVVVEHTSAPDGTIYAVPTKLKVDAGSVDVSATLGGGQQMDFR